MTNDTMVTKIRTRNYQYIGIEITITNGCEKARLRNDQLPCLGYFPCF